MKAHKQHMARVAELGCMISGSTDVCLHHARSGSMKDAGYHFGKSQRPPDWFVIPLQPMYHNTSNEGIHNKGVRSWELVYGTQYDMLCDISRMLGYSVFEKWREENGMV